MRRRSAGATVHLQRRQTTPRRARAPTASALFNERDPRLGGEVGNDVNRDGNPAGSSGIFAVLWDATSEPGLGRHEPEQQLRRPDGDDATTRSTTTSATSAPTTRRRPSRSGCRSSCRPTARTRSSTSASSSGAHGSHVAGIASGNALFGGAMSGAAPGAKLVSVRACLFITGLHGARADRRHDLRRQAAQRRRHQHVDRRPAGAQRRQQCARRALQPPDRAVQRADVHFGRQQRPGHEHDRRSVGRDQGR